LEGRGASSKGEKRRKGEGGGKKGKMSRMISYSILLFLIPFGTAA